MNLSIYCAVWGGFSTSNNSSQSNRKKCTYNFNVHLSISLFPKNIKRRLCGTNFSIVPALYIFQPVITHVSHESISITSSRPFCSRLNMQMGVHRGPYCAQVFYTDPDWISKREKNSHQCPSFFSYQKLHTHTQFFTVFFFYITKWPADDKTSKVVNHLQK